MQEFVMQHVISQMSQAKWVLEQIVTLDVYESLKKYIVLFSTFYTKDCGLTMLSK